MENEISHKIIGAAIEVHRILGGPGLLESIYESSLCYELTQRGLQIQKQLIVPVKYKNTVVRDPLCLDILVENKVIIEVKATEKEHAVHQAQLLTYLRLGRVFKTLTIPNSKRYGPCPQTCLQSFHSGLQYVANF